MKARRGKRFNIEFELIAPIVPGEMIDGTQVLFNDLQNLWWAKPVNNPNFKQIAVCVDDVMDTSEFINNACQNPKSE